MGSLFSFRFETIAKSPSRGVLLVFSAIPSLDIEELATTVEQELEANLLPNEVILVVRGPAFNEALRRLREDSQAIAMLSRLRGRTSVTLTGFDVRGAESEREHVAGPLATRSVTFADFQRRAVTYHFETLPVGIPIDSLGYRISWSGARRSRLWASARCHTYQKVPPEPTLTPRPVF